MPDPPPYRDNPFDHNGECTSCDEPGMHRADCPWLLAMLEDLRQLRAQVTALHVRVEDVADKLQCLVNWVNQQGLLPEHVFTFPDGDTWEATRR